MIAILIRIKTSGRNFVPNEAKHQSKDGSTSLSKIFFQVSLRKSNHKEGNLSQRRFYFIFYQLLFLNCFFFSWVNLLHHTLHHLTATSIGTAEGMDNSHLGACWYHNMKLTLRVLPLTTTTTSSKWIIIVPNF